MIERLVTVLITFVASAPIWGLIGALWSRFRFDGISADYMPSTVGAMGLYSDAVKGFGVRLKVTNVTPTPIALEKIDVAMLLEPLRGTSKIHSARGPCSASIIQDGPYGTDLRMEGYPLVVPSSGGHLYLQLNADMDMQYYSRAQRFLLLPRQRRVDSLGIDDPNAPTDPDGGCTSITSNPPPFN